MNEIYYQDQVQVGFLETPDERQMGLFLHLSVLSSMIFPLAGVIVPIVIWQTQKEKMPAIVPHGKEVANWLITSVIYSVISLVMLFVGVLLIAAELPVFGLILIVLNTLFLIGLSIAGFAYAIIGGIKANNGEHWDYPLNIKFLK